MDVVTHKIPLLISNPTMKALGFIINKRKGEIHVDGTSDNMKPVSTLSGHFKMPICHTTREDCNVTFNVERLIGSTTGEKRQKAVKLHRQMCHASSERLQRLLRNSGCNDKEFLNLINECCQSCEFCRKYKKPFLKPVVGIPVAETFNKVAYMDLKEITKREVVVSTYD